MFTFYAVGNISGHAQREALAKTIEEDEALSDGDTFIMAVDDSREARRLEREEERAARDAAREARRWQRFLDKFERYYDRDVVCSLSESQIVAVEALYDTSVESLALSEGEVDVITAQGERLRASDLRSLIRSSGGDVHCRVLDYQNIFYLLMSAGVS